MARRCRRSRRCSSGTATIRSTVDAAFSGLNGSEHVVLQRLLAATEQTPQRTGAAVDPGGDDRARRRGRAPAGALSDWRRAPGRPPWQRDALLEGAEAALLGGPLPGSGRRGAGGGRGATGGRSSDQCAGRPRRAGRRTGVPRTRPTVHRGAAARDAAAATAAAVAAGARAGGARALAAAGGETGKRAQAAARASDVAGQAGRSRGGARRGAADAGRTAALRRGQDVYTSLCVACHQENGQGREKLAPRWSDRPSRSSRRTCRSASCSTARKARSG